MAAVRHSLQKEIFENNAERLLVYCEVTKLLKKKKTCYLCLVSSSEIHTAINITQVKKIDKNSFKKKRSWLLSEIKSVDGGTDCNVLTLDIFADKLYKWVALNEHDRQQFVTALSQVSSHNKESIDFQHFPDAWIGPQSAQSPDSPLILPTTTTDADVNDIQALSDIEESELAALLGGCDSAINNAEQFMQQLGDKLSALDGQNIESMLASEMQVEALMNKLDEAISYAEIVETRLDRYDDMLRHIRDTMDKMEEKNGMIEIANKNSQKLLQKLKSIISWLDISAISTEIILTTPEGREAALQAGNVIRNALTAPQPPFVHRLAATQEQMRKINKYKDKFTQAVTRHLNNLLIHLSNDASQEIPMEGLSLPNRSAIHNELKEYAPLMHWMKQMDAKAFNGLTKIYVGALYKLYERDFKHFFETAHQMITAGSMAGNAKEKRKSAESREDLSSTSGAAKHFDVVLDAVLSQLEVVCIGEQEFCVNFFQLDSLNKSGQQSMENSFTSETQGTLVLSPSSEQLLSTPTKDLSPGSGSLEQDLRKIKDKIASDTRKLLAELFPTLETELVSLISHYEKLDTYGSMRALSRLGSHVLSAAESVSGSSSFLASVFASCLIQTKRGADRAVGEKLKSMAESTRITGKRNKCGILPYVEDFEEFCTTAESIFGKSGRRADLDKWYVQLVSAMITAIQHHDHPKTPHQVIKMENFHHLYDLLSQLKLPALDGLRKEVKIKYNESLKAYVILYFGRPLEKLNQFFEGVQERVSQGVKEEEISYQSAFSKQELRKVIAMYPHKEVKKGLDSLYKKVEKHLSEEENLLQVVWHAMQEEFITQYKYLEGRIQTCYPGSMISLDFAIQDILEAFSDIARSH